jgi:hypothetical protein
MLALFLFVLLLVLVLPLVLEPDFDAYSAIGTLGSAGCQPAHLGSLPS